jgi:hypothetical protein
MPAVRNTKIVTHVHCSNQYYILSKIIQMVLLPDNVQKS